MPTVLDIDQLPEAEYWIADELDPLGIWWFSALTGQLVPFANEPCSFVLTVVALSDVTTQIFTKSTGFVPLDGSGDGSGDADIPNLTVVWDVGTDLNTITSPGGYEVTIVATRISDGRQRTLQGVLRMRSRH